MNCQDVNSSIQNSGFTFMLWIVPFCIFALVFWKSRSARQFATNKYFVLLTWCLVIVLNLYSYYQNPARLSDEKVCGMLGINMSCRVFNAVTATGALLFDCITLFFLLDSFIEGDKKFKLLICGTFFTIGELFIWLTYHSEKSVSENNFKFLPSPLKCKAFRITIYALIMILDTLAFWQGFMDNNIDVPLFDWKGFKESRFGGYKEGNKLAWTLGFGTAVGAMILDFLATDGTLQYKPDDFKLPAYVMNVLTK